VAEPRAQGDRHARALVTGGAGFIGSHLVDALVARGDHVVVVDDLSTGSEANLRDASARGMTLVVGDIRDTDFVSEVVASERPELVFHLAAQIDVRASVSRPCFDADVNVTGTINVLEAARAAGARRFVLASTGGAIYGDGEPPFGEEALIRPLSPYGQAKYAAEGYCDLYRRLHGLSTVSLRLANVYGPRQDPLGEGGVVAIFGGKLSAGEQPVIFGDGHQIRDFVYVRDIVTAALTASAHHRHGAYNIGTGEGVSVLELAERLREAARELGVHEPGRFDPVFAPEREGEVARSILDPTRAAAELGFTTSTTLDDGLRATLAAIGSTSAAAR
jgi:UDP-glucose 4-epimerase